MHCHLQLLDTGDLTGRAGQIGGPDGDSRYFNAAPAMPGCLFDLDHSSDSIGQPRFQNCAQDRRSGKHPAGHRQSTDPNEAGHHPDQDGTTKA